MVLSGKKIVLGVTGSIAAYKAVLALRLLQEAGANVRVVMTQAATRFVGPLTFETLSRDKVFVDLWADGSSWVEHVHLAEWADAILVAPCTANTLAKLAHGLCDDALTAVCLSARCPVVVAPAMDLQMYAHLQTRRNLEALQAIGYTVVQAPSGYLASGLEGQGRLAEPEALLHALETRLTAPVLRGKRILISAGPTQEAIDPVRYLSNHSSGKMGIALAEAVARMGGKATLVLGPTQLRPAASYNGSVETIRVTTAADMHREMTSRQPGHDCIIMAAAVADYRPATAADQKIKKKAGEDTLNLHLTKTQDILSELSAKRPASQLMVGFALETQNEEDNAKRKLYEKHLDMIVLNSLNDSGAGFGHDTNRVTVLTPGGEAETFPLKLKSEVAHDILTRVAQRLQTLS